jgi:hypothetical protein
MLHLPYAIISQSSPDEPGGNRGVEVSRGIDVQAEPESVTTRALPFAPARCRVKLFGPKAKSNPKGSPRASAFVPVPCRSGATAARSQRARTVVCFDGNIRDTTKPPTVWIVPFADIDTFIDVNSGTKNVSRAAVLRFGNAYRNAWKYISGVP